MPAVAVEDMHPPLAVFGHHQQTRAERDAVRPGERIGERAGRGDLREIDQHLPRGDALALSRVSAWTRRARCSDT